MLDLLKKLSFKNPFSSLRRPVFETLTASSDEVTEDCLKALSCQDGGLGIFRLVHLLDAIQKIPQPSRIISIGSGMGYHEIILAKLFPEAVVVAIDLEKQVHAHRSSNLTNIQGSILDPAFIRQIEPADFVYSIECLEHIDRDGEAFDAMAKLAKPHGAFYIQIPYATDWERNDKETRDREYKTFGHCTPGYDARQLSELADKSQLNVQYIQNVFWTPLQPMLWAAVDKFGADIIHRYTKEILELLMTDFRPELALHRGQCTGIKMLTLKSSA